MRQTHHLPMQYGLRRSMTHPRRGKNHIRKTKGNNSLRMAGISISFAQQAARDLRPAVLYSVLRIIASRGIDKAGASWTTAAAGLYTHSPITGQASPMEARLNKKMAAQRARPTDYHNKHSMHAHSILCFTLALPTSYSVDGLHFTPTHYPSGFSFDGGDHDDDGCLTFAL